ncbi:MAG TPA: DEAD/DEAH box helicase, partial [Actinotalea sp.]|nr:DEAD/DEAH box helicase [Actinotalea sp.]
MPATAATDQVVPAATDHAAAPSFAELGLTGPVLAALTDVGYETPSAIQAATIPALLDGRDVIGKAQTGTGKTAAFALPILQRLDLRQKSPQALVLAPTRELALQVCEAIERYASRTSGVRTLPVYGGQAYGVQLSALRRGVHVVVGTPGRIMDHLDKGTLDLSALRFLVLDEADEMLQMGFVEDVETILASTPDDKQVALFSATMPAPIRRLADAYLRRPLELAVEHATATATNVAQRYLIASYAQKLDALTRILEVENFEAMIVFTRTRNETEVVAEKLRARGLAAAAISGDVPQPQREKTVRQLREGALDILVATDVAARGIDVQHVSHVVNYDVPSAAESYVHGIGRAGEATSFVAPRERRLLAAIEQAPRQPMTQMRLPTAEDVNDARLARFDDAIFLDLGGTTEIDQFRDIVTHYVAHHEVPEVDVAAALAVVAHGAPLLLDVAQDAERERFEAEKAAALAERRRGGRAEREREDGGTGAGSGRVSGGGSGGRDAGRDPAGARASARHPAAADMTTYRIAVGKRHKVEPRQIVGAIANEGGLRRGDFGKITIGPGFSLVDLPSDLSAEVVRRLERTRINGVLINLTRDAGRTSRPSAHGQGRSDAGGGRRP